MSEWMARWAALPRAAKWGIAAILALIAYFGAIEPGLDAMNRWNTRAANKERELAAFARERDQRKGADKAASLGVSRFGLVEPPGDPGERLEAFNRRIAEVLEKEGIRQSATSSGTAQLPPRSPLQKDLGDVARVEKITNDIRFDATPEQLARVVAALEQSPEIAGISYLQVQQGGSGPGSDKRALRVSLKVQAWQASPKAKGKAS